MSFMPEAPSRCAACHLLPAAFYSEGPGSIPALEAMRSGSRTVRADQMIYREGEQASDICVLYDGWAIRHKLLSDGRRQILSFMLPGDPLGLPLLHVDRLPFSVQALTAASICTFRRAELAAFVAARPQLAWQADHICAEATRAADERLVDIGRRSAYERVGRLILELATRLKAKGLSDGSTARLPLHQVHLADALGLTPIHVGRVLQRLRADGILSLSRGRLEIQDPEALRTL